MRHREALRTWDPDGYVRAWALRLLQATSAEERARATARLLELGGAGISLYNISAALLLAGDSATGGALAAVAVRAPHASFIRQAWANLGISHERRGDLATAALVARQGLLRYPADPNLYAILVDALRRTGRHADAVAAVARARPLLPDDDSREAEACLFDCVQALIQAGQPGEAMALVDEARSPRARSPRLHAAIALAKVHLGRLAQARTSLARAEDSGEPARLHARALLCAREGDSDGARAAAREAKAAGYTELGALERDLATAGLSAAGTRSRARGRGRSR